MSKTSEAPILDPAGDVAEAARRVQRALTQLGYCYETKGGDLVQVGFKSLTLSGEHYGLLEVDTTRLPRRVTVPDLAHPKTLHHLTAVVGRPVKRLNTSGLTYVLVLQPPRRGRLPRRVDLDLDQRPAAGPYLVPIGAGRDGPIWRTLGQLDAVLIGGTRRLGKSTWINAALAALLSAHGPGDLQLALVDPKEVELTTWAEAPHLLGPVATDAESAAGLLGRVWGELENRRALFAGTGARNLGRYNAQASQPLPAILLVIDELADLAIDAGGPKAELFKLISRLIGKGGAFGIYAILATQRPDAEAIAGLLKANLSTRLAFWLPSSLDYRLVLNPAPGQRLPQLEHHAGRLLARLPDLGYTVLQGFYLDDEQAAAIAQRVAGHPPEGAALDQQQARLIAWAVEDQAGYLTIETLAQGLGLKKWKAEQLAKNWERRGWLVKDASQGNKRRVTGALLDLLRVVSGGDSTEPGQVSGPGGGFLTVSGASGFRQNGAGGQPGKTAREVGR